MRQTTPYTSYLVTDAAVLGAEAQDNLAEEAYKQILATPPLITGQEVVERAAAESEFGAAEAPLAPSADVVDLVRVVGSRTFRLTEGIWVDTAFDPQSMSTMRVPFLSEDYFALVGADATLAAAFALGERVIAISGGQAYEVIASDQQGDPIAFPAPESEQPSLPEEIDPAPAAQIEEPEKVGGLSLPCPGSLITFGMVSLALGFFQGKRRFDNLA